MLSNVRSTVYDTFIVSMTSTWYREVLTRCPMDAHLLDVGIGTATSLLDNRDQIISKRLHVTGVDYDADYVKTAKENVRSHHMDGAVEVVQASIHDFTNGGGDPYDAVYFSGSFMIIPNQVAALQRCVAMLRGSGGNDGGSAVKSRESPTKTTEVSDFKTKASGMGTIFFTQTFEKPSLIGKYITPLVKRILRFATTIDFGSVTFEADFNRVLEEARVDIVSKVVLRDSYFRTEVLVVAKPRDTTTTVA